MHAMQDEPVCGYCLGTARWFWGRVIHLKRVDGVSSHVVEQVQEHLLALDKQDGGMRSELREIVLAGCFTLGVTKSANLNTHCARVALFLNIFLVQGGNYEVLRTPLGRNTNPLF